MWKLATVIWLVLGVTFAGIAIMVVLLVPSLNSQDMSAIPIAAGVGALIAIPVSLFVAKRVYALTQRKAPQSQS